MKSLLFALGSTMLRNWIASPQQSSPQQLPYASVPKLNVPYLRFLGKKYASHLLSAFIFSLFFVAGSVMAIFSVAQSFDLFGLFVAGTVFYTGFFLALLSVGIVALNIKAIMKLKIDEERFYLYEQMPLNSGDRESNFPFLKYASPIVTGIISGWASNRSRRRETAMPSEESPRYQGPRAV